MNRLIGLLLLLASQQCLAVEVKPGEIYTAETEVTSSPLGFTLTIPDAQPENKQGYVQNDYQVVGSSIPLIVSFAAKALREGLSLATILMSTNVDQEKREVVIRLTTDLRLSEPAAPELAQDAAS